MKYLIKFMQIINRKKRSRRVVAWGWEKERVITQSKESFSFTRLKECWRLYNNVNIQLY
jgi:hypothetical protein